MFDQSRRKFLARTLAIGCSAAASPLITPVTLAALPSDNRFVVIILRGGMDGLGVVSPVGDPLFSTYRPSLAVARHLDLDGYFALNSKLGDLWPMWQQGELAFVQAVSTPYRNKRSHFDGQDILESGVASLESTAHDSGWVNRMLAQMPGSTKETAFSVGRENMLLLRGDRPSSSWAPEGRIDLSSQGRLMLEAIYQKDPLFAEAGAVALTLAAQNAQATGGGADDGAMMTDILENMVQSTRSQKAENLAAFAAGRLKLETRLAAFSIGGWDTHQKQNKTINRALGQLQAALLTLKTELGPVWNKTTVVCMTEFGRTVAENGSQGTDHGTGGAMVLAGGAIKGKRVFTDWPGLAEQDLFVGRDLMPTSDVRRYVAWILRDMFGLGRLALETSIFPGLDMGGNPGVVL